MTGWRILSRSMAGFTLIFLIAPLLVIVPLSFNAEPFFTFTPKMLAFDSEGYSLRWYRAILDDDVWRGALINSLIIGGLATLIATVLGTLAAMGLARGNVPAKGLIMGLIISPMITPMVISAAGMYFFYSDFGLTQTHLGLIIAHACLGVPFVVITVTASLTGYDWNLTRAGLSLGADPWTVFFRVTLPLILPGVISGALFAFATSFDEVVTVLFLGGPEQVTIPRKMWSGIREQISPAILAAATLLIVVAALLLVCVEWLRRRNERLQVSTR
ncbi:Inner membrane ABC transporter permease protein YdcV [Alphaproteobacteria bacterium SO-S41]|nr:Inner membrane ABC transporter permease protein YdcV [Alphaproteobacteria bacterium SO-S41]